MRPATTKVCRPTRFATALVAGAAFCASGFASAADEPRVYKCKSDVGSVTYQDYPCKGAVVVDIKPDAADPHAIARLERANAEFNQAASRRQADEAAEAMRRAEFDIRRREAEAALRFTPPDPGYSTPYYGYYDYYGYVPYVTDRASRNRPPVRTERQRGRSESRVPAEIRRPHPG